MDIRNFPGGPSQGVLVPSSALREAVTASQLSDQSIMQDLAVGNLTGLVTYANAGNITQAGTPNMTVLISPFDAYGSNGTVIQNGLGFNPNCSTQTGCSFTAINGSNPTDGLNAQATVTIAPANTSNPRRDLICWQIQTINLDLATNSIQTISLNAINPSTGLATTPATVYPNTIQRVALQYVQGTAAATPSLPSIPSGWNALAEVYVGANVTTIVNANIFFAVPLGNRGQSTLPLSSFINEGLVYTTGSGLTANINALSVNIGGSFYAIGSSTLAMTNNTTNYVYVNNSGILATQTGSFPSNSIPLATVVASNGNITTVTDKRSWLNIPNGSGSSGSPYTLSFSDKIGLDVIWNSSTQVTINAGYCLTDDYSTVLNLTSNQAVGTGTTGANGVETGTTLTNGTMYYLWLIYNPTSLQVAGLISASSTSPTLPSGFTLKRRMPVGLAYNSGILAFRYIEKSLWFPKYHYGNFTDNELHSGIVTNRILSAGATTRTTVSCGYYVPAGAIMAKLVCILSGNSDPSFIPTGDTGLGIVTPPSIFEIELNSSGQFDYFLDFASSGATIDVGVYGYQWGLA